MEIYRGFGPERRGLDQTFTGGSNLVGEFGQVHPCMDPGGSTIKRPPPRALLGFLGLSYSHTGGTATRHRVAAGSASPVSELNFGPRRYTPDLVRCIRPFSTPNVAGRHALTSAVLIRRNPILRVTAGDCSFRQRQEQTLRNLSAGSSSRPFRRFRGIPDCNQFCS